MKRSTPNPLLPILLFAIGTFSIAYTFGSQSSWTNISIAIGIFALCVIWAFVRFLQWRDGKRPQFIQAQPTPPRPGYEGTIYGLMPGNNYRVVKTFTDFYGDTFEKGEELHFQTRHFLPYDGGHTIVFKNRRLYLQEDKNRDILDNFSEYIIQIE